MTDALELTDQQSKAVQVAPRVSKAYIESQISRTYCFTLDTALREMPGSEDFSHHTYCVLHTKNGFTVTGHSAPASPENYNAELGRQYAYENAFRQLWPLFAFALLQDGIGESVLSDPLNQAA